MYSHILCSFFCQELMQPPEVLMNHLPRLRLWSPPGLCFGTPAVFSADHFHQHRQVCCQHSCGGHDEMESWRRLETWRLVARTTISSSTSARQKRCCRKHQRTDGTFLWKTCHGPVTSSPSEMTKGLQNTFSGDKDFPHLQHREHQDISAQF